MGTGQGARGRLLGWTLLVSTLTCNTCVQQWRQIDEDTDVPSPKRHFIYTKIHNQSIHVRWSWRSVGLTYLCVCTYTLYMFVLSYMSGFLKEP